MYICSYSVENALSKTVAAFMPVVLTNFVHYTYLSFAQDYESVASNKLLNM